MTVKFNGRNLPVGTVLIVGVKYPASPKVYSYCLMNVSETHGWYATGQGPQAAGWAVVERWLAKEGREVVWVKGVTTDAMPLLWTAETGSVPPGWSRTQTDGSRSGTGDGRPEPHEHRASCHGAVGELLCGHP